MHTHLVNKTGQKETYTQTNNRTRDWSRKLEKSYCQSDWRIGWWTNRKCSVALLHWGGKIKGLDQCENWNSNGTNDQGIQKKADLPVEKLIPEDLHDFLDVFDNNKANWFPESNMWDHKIDMKEGFEPESFKNYNLTPEEQKELDKFLHKNSEKGYIWPSQSPQASPFFFVKKKDGRLQPCQDYWYLNDWTVKNKYPLPLILEIMDKLKGAKYFSKFDVWWGYNNIWIRSGDE
jgi:hypothetical protein